MDFLFDNPEFTRHARVNLALPRLLWWVCAYVTLLGIVMAANFVFYVYGAGTTYATPAECARSIFQQILGINWLVLTLAGASKLSSAVASEYHGLTLDAQRLSPVDARVFPVGKLFGVPVRGYLYVLASMPFAALCVLLGGVRLLAAAQCYAVLLTGTLFYHSIALLRFRSPRPNEVTGAGAVFAAVLTYGGFSLSLRGNFGLLVLPSIGPLLRDLSQFGECSFFVGGVELPASPFAIPGYLIGAWLCCSIAARTLRFPTRPILSKPAAVFVYLLALLVALAVCPTGAMDYGSDGRLRVGVFALAMLLFGLTFALAVAIDPFDYRVCARMALQVRRSPRWLEERNEPAKLIGLVAAAAALVTAGRTLTLDPDQQGALVLVHKLGCSLLVGAAIFGQGLLIAWGRLVWRSSGHMVVAFALLALQLFGPILAAVLNNLHVPGGELLFWTSPPFFIFGEIVLPSARSPESTLLQAGGFLAVQCALVLLGQRLHRRARRAIDARARSTLERAGLLPAAALALLLACAWPAWSDGPAVGPGIASGLHAYRVEFWCRQGGWAPQADGTDSVYTKFLVWDTAAQGVHPERFDVAVYVANDTGKPIENVALAMRERRLTGSVVRLEKGEFVGLVDRAGSLAAAHWSERPATPGWTYTIRRIEPGARKKIIFHDVGLGATPEDLRKARPFCWKVAYDVEIQAGGDRTTQGQCEGDLEVGFEE